MPLIRKYFRFILGPFLCSSMIDVLFEGQNFLERSNFILIDSMGLSSCPHSSGVFAIWVGPYHRTFLDFLLHKGWPKIDYKSILQTAPSYSLLFTYSRTWDRSSLMLVRKSKHCNEVWYIELYYAICMFKYLMKQLTSSCTLFCLANCISKNSWHPLTPRFPVPFPNHAHRIKNTKLAQEACKSLTCDPSK